MNNNMWTQIFTVEAMMYMKKVTGETEDDSTIERFFHHVRERVKDHNLLIDVATDWNSHSTEMQVRQAVEYAGMYHISRFIMLMEYMSNKIHKGDLK